MGFIKGLFNVLSGGIIGEVGKAIDDNVTSDEERLTLHNALATIHAKAKEKENEFTVKIEEQLSGRHKEDMKSDSWLSKNIRPMTLVFLTLSTILYMVYGLNVEMPEGSQKFMVYNAGLQGLLGLDLMVYGFYFGSRGVEKVMASVAAAMTAKPKREPKYEDDDNELGW